MTDVLDEAATIRKALEAIGWKYAGGGPYPMRPKLHFLRGNDRLEVTVTIGART